MSDIIKLARLLSLPTRFDNFEPFDRLYAAPQPTYTGEDDVQF